MSADLCSLTITELSRLLRSRKLSSIELTRAYLERIEAYQPKLDAFLTVTRDLALRQARRADKEIAAGDYRGPMHGIAFGLKDIYATKGIMTSGGSKLCRDNLPQKDSTCSMRREAFCSENCRRTNSPTVGHRSTCRGLRRATHGSLSTSRGGHRADRVPLSPHRSWPAPWAPIPEGRSADHRRFAALPASCRAPVW
jgi:hypothetical protein